MSTRRTQKAKTPTPTVEVVPIESLQALGANPRKHGARDLGYLQDVIERVGASRSGVIDEHGVVLAGNGMREASMNAGLRHALIVDADGETPVFVRRTGLTEAQKAELVVADNQAAQLSGWDLDLLKQYAEDNPDVRKGWTDEEWAALMASGHVVKAGKTDPDAVPEPRHTDIQPGQLFALGSHRLLCGDCTDPAVVERLMDGTRAGVMNTDPPYGVAYTNDERPNPGVAKPRVAKPRVANDTLSDAALQQFLEQSFGVAKLCALAENAAWYLWHAHLTQGYFAAAAAAAAVILHRQIIWVKPVLLLGRGQYHWKHEPCFMGWVEGHQPPDYGFGAGERTQTTVWEVGSVTHAERKTFDHSTPKPVGLFTTPIVKHLRPGEACYEPFAGSGPQFIAAEQHGVRCFGGRSSCDRYRTHAQTA